MSFDFINHNNGINPITGTPTGQAPTPQQKVPVKPPEPEPTIVTSGKRFFSVVKDKGEDRNAIVPIDLIPDAEVEKRKRGRPKKETGGPITRPEKVDGTVEDRPTGYTYMETTAMLKETLGQIDSLNSELMNEFTAVKNSRTLKNKYQTLIGLSENVGSLLGNKISAIREINSSISKANDLDYKKDKDRRAATAAMDDDKYIADLYKSFIRNPMNVAPTPQVPQVDPAIFGSGIVRADLKSGNYNSNDQVDVSYLNYVSNLTPEQNLMRYEGNNNIKQVVVYDNATGNRFFQMMDMSTGQVIPNVPVYDQMFMEDTTIDLATKTAKNINLNETFPVVVINEGVTSQY